MTFPLQHRREQLFQYLSDCGLAAALLNHPLTIAYFTGVKIKPYERFVGLVFDGCNRTATLILPSLEKSAEADPGVAKVLYGDHEDPLACLTELVDAVDRLGVEKESLVVSQAEMVSERLKTQLVDISRFVLGLRLCKDEAEVTSIRQAARYGDGFLAQIAPRLKPGTTEKAIMFAMLEAMSQQPGVLLDEYVIQVLSGVNSANPHGSSGDKVFEEGDAVTIDFIVYYQHYWSDCTRTFFVGRPQDHLEEIYRVVLEAQQQALATVRAGVALRDIDLAARRVIEKAGYGEYFIHRTGHGLGLDIHEVPSIHGNNHDMIKPGMIFTVEPGIYIPGLGGVRIEDDVVVTARGSEILTTYPKDFESMVIGK
jgi:Xaa-Pro dipeptidase